MLTISADRVARIASDIFRAAGATASELGVKVE